MDDEIQALRRRLAEDPGDARARLQLGRLVVRKADAGFERAIVSALSILERTRLEDALLVASLTRQVLSQNWGVAFRFQDDGDGVGDARDGTYVAVRCFWAELEERWRGTPPSRYTFEFTKRQTTNYAQVATTVNLIGCDRGDEVRAWASSLIFDDGKRRERWTSMIEGGLVLSGGDPAS